MKDTCTCLLCRGRRSLRALLPGADPVRELAVHRRRAVAAGLRLVREVRAAVRSVLRAYL